MPVLTFPASWKEGFYWADGKKVRFSPDEKRLHQTFPADADKAMAIFVSSWIPEVDPRNKLYVLVQNDLYHSLARDKIDYILVQRRRNYLTLYFDRNDCFEKIATFVGAGAIKIYRRKDIENRDSFILKPLISRNAVLYLARLKSKEPAKFQYFLGDIFSPLLGWDLRMVEELISLEKNRDSDRFTYVENGKIY